MSQKICHNIALFSSYNDLHAIDLSYSRSIFKNSRNTLFHCYVTLEIKVKMQKKNLTNRKFLLKNERFIAFWDAFTATLLNVCFFGGFSVTNSKERYWINIYPFQRKGSLIGEELFGLDCEKTVLADTLIKILKLTVLIIECFFLKVTSATKVFFVIK